MSFQQSTLITTLQMVLKILKILSKCHVCINEVPKPYAKFLGVLIDPQLSFKAHIKSVSKKLSTALNFMRKARNILNEHALKFIYNSTSMLSLWVWTMVA